MCLIIALKPHALSWFSENSPAAWQNVSRHRAVSARIGPSQKALTIQQRSKRTNQILNYVPSLTYVYAYTTFSIRPFSNVPSWTRYIARWRLSSFNNASYTTYFIDLIRRCSSFVEQKSSFRDVHQFGGLLTGRIEQFTMAPTLDSAIITSLFDGHSWNPILLSNI